MAAFSHFDYFESRAQFLRVPVVSASRVIARRSIDLKEIAGRVRAVAILEPGLENQIGLF